MRKKNCEIARRVLFVNVKILILLSGILLSPAFHFPVYAHNRENVDFDHITLEHGLSQNNVYAVVQDWRGFMWFGTEDGLNRYDGYEFKVFKPDPDNPHSISDGYIYVIFEDRSHLLWIGTGSGGLNRFDRETGRFKHYYYHDDDPNSLSYNCVTSISEYGKEPGKLWLGTRGGGLNKFDINTETFTHYRHIPEDPHSLSNDNIYQIYFDRSGTLWLATEGGGLNRFDRQKEQFTRYRHDPDNPDSLSDDFVTTIFEDRKGRLWIGTDKGMDRFDRLKNQFIHYRHNSDDPGSLSEDRVRFIFQDHADTLWIGTLTGGLNQWREETGKFVHYGFDPLDPGGLSDNDIYCIYEDRFHVLWIGTEGGGANKLDLEKKPFAHYRVNLVNPGGLSHNDIWAICESRKNPGIVWIGTKGGGLNKFDREKGTFVHYRHQPDNPHSLSSDSIFVICEDRAGMLWIGTDGFGLNRMDVEEETFTRYTYNPDDPDGISGDDVWTLCEDRSGVLWVGTLSGLNRFNRETGKFTGFRYNADDPGSIGSNDIWTIYEDRSGVLWIGTDNGLNKFHRETGTFTRYIYRQDNLNSLNNNRVLCIYQDSSGTYWIGTLGGGLDKFDPVLERFTHYTEKHGLPSNVVYGILEEDPSPGSTGSHLWFSTNGGLVRFNPRTGKFKNYNKRDGLQGNEFNAGAYHKNKDGEMFFGGINGFNYFHPRDIKDNPYIPPVVITELQVFNETVEPGKRINGRGILTKTITETREIRLSHDEEVISFKFAALHYSASGENQYAYRMVGIEDGWNNAGDRRFATYTGLPPGEYTFQVRASNNDGVWNEKGASLEITIVPPFWRTGWFYLLFVLAVLFSGLGIHQLRVSGLKKQERKLTRLVKERTQELEKTTETVQAMNIELKKAKEKAEKERQTAEIANHYKSDFLARMSHEIRTPMNSIIGFADLMLDTSLRTEQVNFVRAIKQSGEELLGIINEILDISRIETGRFLLESTVFDPRATAINVYQLILPGIGKKPIEVFCRTADNLPANVKGDDTRFRQVLINLMENAVKFTRRGEVQLTMEVEKEENHRVKLHTTVKDTGIGIPEDKQELIFEAFQQVDTGDTREFGGAGLGLSICRQIAQLMAGDIRVESEPGKGSTFHFTAWMEKIEKVKGGSVPGLAQQPVKGKKTLPVCILMAEDNKLNRKLARFMLNKEGYGVDIVSTGKEAVEKFISDPAGYDLILMDIQMPEMDGKEAARLIREKGFTQVPIIALTAASMKGDREKCMEAGMNDYISKPIKKEILFEVIKKWLPDN